MISYLTGRGSGRKLWILTVIAVLFVLQAGTASAHAILVSSTPASDRVVEDSPGQVTMVFNEPVEVSFGSVRVFDTGGTQVEAGTATHVGNDPKKVGVPLKPDLAEGTYLVSYRVVSADAHPIEGGFQFYVGHPSKRAGAIPGLDRPGAGSLEAILFGITRWINFIGLLALAGAAIFMFVSWRRPRGALLQRPPEVEAAFAQRWCRVVVVAWSLVTVATLASFVLQTAVAGDLPLSQAVAPSAFTQVFGTRFGIVGLLKLSALVALAVVWWPAMKSGSMLQPATREMSLGAGAALPDMPMGLMVFGGALVLLLLLTPGAAGHAGTTPPAALNMAVDAVHLMAASAWVGGLAMLFLGAFPAARRGPEEERGRLLAPVVTHFSDMAVIAVGVIVATGVYQSWLQVRSISGLTAAAYGWVLLSKVGVFLPLVALGFINNRWSKPQIEKAASAETASKPLATLRRLVGVEMVLGVVVLALTAVLVNLAPARTVAGTTGPFIEDVALGNNNLEVLVDPNQVGSNEVHLTATKPDGTPARIKNMQVLFTLPAKNIGPIEADGRRLAPGHFVVQGNQLSVPGRWNLEIVSRKSLFEEDRADVQVIVDQ